MVTLAPQTQISAGQSTLVVVIGIANPYPDTETRLRIAEGLNERFDTERREPDNSIRFLSDLTTTEQNLLNNPTYALKCISVCPETVTNIPKIAENGESLIQDRLEDTYNLTVTGTTSLVY